MFSCQKETDKRKYAKNQIIYIKKVFCEQNTKDTMRTGHRNFHWKFQLYILHSSRENHILNVNDWLTYRQNEECTGGRTGLRKDKVNNQVDLLLKSLTKEDYARTINEINRKS